MTSEQPPFTTEELSVERWPAFEHLFTQGNGWDFCWCTYFQRVRVPAGQVQVRTRAQASVRNRAEKRRLVQEDRAHGVLVYAGEEAVGWCQFGRTTELPRIDTNPQYRAEPGAVDPDPDWRITCFVVRKEHRRQGVASLALGAALAAIAERGGGIVDAYPVRGGPPSASYNGTVSMFERSGFDAIAPAGKAHVVMRKVV